MNKVKRIITDPNEIVEYFNEEVAGKGHFDCRMPDDTEDDYDTCIPEYAVKQHWKCKELVCNDSNGSGVGYCCLKNGDKPKFILDVDGRDFTVDGDDFPHWEIAEILCTIKQIEIIDQGDDYDDIECVVIEDVKILTINEDVV